MSSAEDFSMYVFLQCISHFRPLSFLWARDDPSRARSQTASEGCTSRRRPLIASSLSRALFLESADSYVDGLSVFKRPSNRKVLQNTFGSFYYCKTWSEIVIVTWICQEFFWNWFRNRYSKRDLGNLWVRHLIFVMFFFVNFEVEKLIIFNEISIT